MIADTLISKLIFNLKLSPFIIGMSLKHVHNTLLSFLNREQTYDVLFEGDDEGKSVATLLLDAIINVRLCVLLLLQL